MAAVQAAYGLRPAVPGTWPAAPAAESRLGPQDLADKDLANGWTDRLLFHVIAALTPKARAILRRITDLNGTAAYDDVQQHFADHPTHPTPLSQIGGTLDPVGALARRRGPRGPGPQ
ncbi:hypothetical protein ACF05F_34965, partial [Rhodococcus erythropolis]